MPSTSSPSSFGARPDTLHNALMVRSRPVEEVGPPPLALFSFLLLPILCGLYSRVAGRYLAEEVMPLDSSAHLHSIRRLAN
mmetsp:Transcript_2879/g.6161  ORF Transcript_2879/g.6161 Transcript_2879/m.6161 type:complete len:81 (+) Transcript_2879:1390-1632(+)